MLSQHQQDLHVLQTTSTCQVDQAVTAQQLELLGQQVHRVLDFKARPAAAAHVLDDLVTDPATGQFEQVVEQVIGEDRVGGLDRWQRLVQRGYPALVAMET